MAFEQCASLTSITIPKKVTRIGDYAFYGCTNLTSVTFQGTIAADKFGSVNDGYSFSPFNGDLRAKYLAGGIGTYKVTEKEKDYDIPKTWTKQ